MLSNHVGWEYASGGNVPPEAIAVGQTVDGEKLYVGRALHEGTLTPGKVMQNVQYYSNCSEKYE